MKRKINYNYNYDDNYLYFQVIENIVAGLRCPDTKGKDGNKHCGFVEV